MFKSYKHSYDNLNRLLSSLYYDSNNVSSGANFESFQYDKQGNISYISRMNNTGGTPLDLLNLYYYGNQLKSVVDHYPPTNQYGAKEYIDRASSKEFSFDQNGNMIKDLDRDTVTIRYNILNLPDAIQFKNGNQIINRYAADGRKLETEYFTKVVPIVLPIDKDTVCNWTFTPGSINQTGMIYIDNKDYKITNGMLQSFYLLRLHNAEGFADNITINPYGPYYYYYHKDHLGNNREVWRAAYTINSTVTPAATIQQTQYFPSGLPWQEGTSASAQPYKYNIRSLSKCMGMILMTMGLGGILQRVGDL